MSKREETSEPAALIDHIYEAALIPDLWPSVLDRVAALCGAAGGVVFVAAPRMSWLATPSYAGLMESAVTEGWIRHNRRPERAAALDRAGFVHDLDIFTVEEIAADPLYIELRERGYGWCTGTVVRTPTDDTIIYSWEGARDRGPFREEVVRGLDFLRPHLARAGVLAARLGLEKARAAATVLGMLGLPAAVLSHGHRLLAANDLCEVLIPSVLRDRRERVQLADASADALLTAALRAQGSGRTEPGVASVPIPARAGHPALIAHVLPLRGRARDVFSAASVLLVFTPVAVASALSATLIRGLFDLTAAEARVAHAVASGERVEAISASQGVSPETTRAQLKSVFAKTGVARQAELANLLRGLTPASRDG